MHGTGPPKVDSARAKDTGGLERGQQFLTRTLSLLILLARFSTRFPLLACFFLKAASLPSLCPASALLPCCEDHHLVASLLV